MTEEAFKRSWLVVHVLGGAVFVNGENCIDVLLSFGFEELFLTVPSGDQCFVLKKIVSFFLNGYAIPTLTCYSFYTRACCNFLYFFAPLVSSHQ